jgi:3-dehydroquinate dehydratase-1
VDAVDMELQALEIQMDLAKACKAAGKTLLISHHDLAGTPEDAKLAELTERSKSLGADIVKLACLAHSRQDLIRLLNFTDSKRSLGMVGISMGPLGAMSRVAGPLYGSLLTYTSQEQIYGQLPLAELVRCLKAFYPDFAAEWPG